MKFILVRRDIFISYRLRKSAGLLCSSGKCLLWVFPEGWGLRRVLFLDFDFHVNVDAPALEVVHETVVFHDTADVGGISYFQISQPLAGDSQTAAIFRGMGSPWGQWVGWFR